ncbi:MAG: secreted protein [Mycobacterium sp.]|jgi:sirohydrochlorin ferrochelatase|nr:secreted protein [Mycobacterium sp.]
MSTLVLTAHGSADPRSPAITQAVAGRIRRLRPRLDVRVAFCEQTSPNVRDVLSGVADDRSGGAVVTPLLLANAYHARVDIPGMIADSGVRQRGLPVERADVLGEDARLLRVLRERLTGLGVSRLDGDLGVLLVAVGSSDNAANAQTATVASAVAAGTRWAGAAMAFATGPFNPAKPTVAEAAVRLRSGGATRLVIAPWFLAPGRITDRVAAYARDEAIPMAQPLGAHRLVAETVLDRYDAAVAARAAA